MSQWIILGLIIAALVIYAIIPNHTAYKCPKCGESFVPKKSQLMGLHSFGSHLLKCPHCGHTSMMGRAGGTK